MQAPEFQLIFDQIRNDFKPQKGLSKEEETRQEIIQTRIKNSTKETSMISQELGEWFETDKINPLKKKLLVYFKKVAPTGNQWDIIAHFKRSIVDRLTRLLPDIDIPRLDLLGESNANVEARRRLCQEISQHIQNSELEEKEIYIHAFELITALQALHQQDSTKGNYRNPLYKDGTDRYREWLCYMYLASQFFEPEDILLITREKDESDEDFKNKVFQFHVRVVSDIIRGHNEDQVGWDRYHPENAPSCTTGAEGRLLMSGSWHKSLTLFILEPIYNNPINMIDAAIINQMLQALNLENSRKLVLLLDDMSQGEVPPYPFQAFFNWTEEEKLALAKKLTKELIYEWTIDLSDEYKALAAELHALEIQSLFLEKINFLLENKYTTQELPTHQSGLSITHDTFERFKKGALRKLFEDSNDAEVLFLEFQEIPGMMEFYCKEKGVAAALELWRNLPKYQKELNQPQPTPQYLLWLVEGIIASRGRGVNDLGEEEKNSLLVILIVNDKERIEDPEEKKRLSRIVSLRQNLLTSFSWEQLTALFSGILGRDWKLVLMTTPLGDYLIENALRTKQYDTFYKVSQIDLTSTMFNEKIYGAIRVALLAELAELKVSFLDYLLGKFTEYKPLILTFLKELTPQQVFNLLNGEEFRRSPNKLEIIMEILNRLPVEKNISILDYLVTPEIGIGEGCLSYIKHLKDNGASEAIREKALDCWYSLYLNAIQGKVLDACRAFWKLGFKDEIKTILLDISSALSLPFENDELKALKQEDLKFWLALMKHHGVTELWVQKDYERAFKAGDLETCRLFLPLFSLHIDYYKLFPAINPKEEIRAECLSYIKSLTGNEVPAEIREKAIDTWSSICREAIRKQLPGNCRALWNLGLQEEIKVHLLESFNKVLITSPSRKDKSFFSFLLGVIADNHVTEPWVQALYNQAYQAGKWETCRLFLPVFNRYPDYYQICFPVEPGTEVSKGFLVYINDLMVNEQTPEVVREHARNRWEEIRINAVQNKLPKTCCALWDLGHQQTIKDALINTFNELLTEENSNARTLKRDDLRFWLSVIVQKGTKQDWVQALYDEAYRLRDWETCRLFLIVFNEAPFSYRLFPKLNLEDISEECLRYIENLKNHTKGDIRSVAIAEWLLICRQAMENKLPNTCRALWRLGGQPNIKETFLKIIDELLSESNEEVKEDQRKALSFWLGVISDNHATEDWLQTSYDQAFKAGDWKTCRLFLPLFSRHSDYYQLRLSVDFESEIPAGYLAYLKDLVVNNENSQAIQENARHCLSAICKTAIQRKLSETCRVLWKLGLQEEIKSQLLEIFNSLLQEDDIDLKAPKRQELNFWLRIIKDNEVQKDWIQTIYDQAYQAQDWETCRLFLPILACHSGYQIRLSISLEAEIPAGHLAYINDLIVNNEIPQLIREEANNLWRTITLNAIQKRLPGTCRALWKLGYQQDIKDALIGTFNTLLTEKAIEDKVLKRAELSFWLAIMSDNRVQADWIQALYDQAYQAQDWETCRLFLPVLSCNLESYQLFPAFNPEAEVSEGCLSYIKDLKDNDLGGGIQKKAMSYWEEIVLNAVQRKLPETCRALWKLGFQKEIRNIVLQTFDRVWREPQVALKVSGRKKLSFWLSIIEENKVAQGWIQGLYDQAYRVDDWKTCHLFLSVFSQNPEFYRIRFPLNLEVEIKEECLAYIKDLMTNDKLLEETQNSAKNVWNTICINAIQKRLPGTCRALWKLGYQQDIKDALIGTFNTLLTEKAIEDKVLKRAELSFWLAIMSDNGVQADWIQVLYDQAYQAEDWETCRLFLPVFSHHLTDYSLFPPINPEVEVSESCCAYIKDLKDNGPRRAVRRQAENYLEEIHENAIQKKLPETCGALWRLGSHQGIKEALIGSFNAFLSEENIEHKALRVEEVSFWLSIIADNRVQEEWVQALYNEAYRAGDWETCRLFLPIFRHHPDYYELLPYVDFVASSSQATFCEVIEQIMYGEENRELLLALAGQSAPEKVGALSHLLISPVSRMRYTGDIEEIRQLTTLVKEELDKLISSQLKHLLGRDLPSDKQIKLSEITGELVQKFTAYFAEFPADPELALSSYQDIISAAQASMHEKLGEEADFDMRSFLLNALLVLLTGGLGLIAILINKACGEPPLFSDATRTPKDYLKTTFRGLNIAGNGFFREVGTAVNEEEGLDEGLPEGLLHSSSV